MNMAVVPSESALAVAILLARQHLVGEKKSAKAENRAWRVETAASDSLLRLYWPRLPYCSESFGLILHEVCCVTRWWEV